MPNFDEYADLEPGRIQRALADNEPLLDPPPELWDKIAAETQPTPQELPAAPRRVIDPHPSRRVVLGSIIGLAAGLAIGFGWNALDLADKSQEQVLSSAVLTSMESQDQELGRAELHRLSDGAVELHLKLQAEPQRQDGYVEVWLINNDGARMVSVGVFAGGSAATFPIDPSLIDSGYTIVDLSNEAFDDDPKHSGKTIMRGALS